jgi:hypothetical protein
MDRIVDVDYRHDPADDRDRLTAQSLRVAGAIPAFVMRVHDLLRHLECLIVTHPDALLRLQNDIAPEHGMLPHLRQLVRRQRAWFIEHLIANPHLADIVNRRERREQVDALAGEIWPELRVGR